MKEKKIEIKCSGTKNVRLESFKELQGNLKELSKVNYEKLKASILKYGFSFPIFCYKQKETHWILDAHQRLKTLKLLQEDGYYIPDLPTVFIEAKDKREAKEKLLQLNSNYGKFTDEGLYEFMNEPGFEIDSALLKDIDLPDIDLEKFELGYYKEQDEEKLNDVPELQEKAISKLGDLFLIDGKHRVLCGDSTKEESYKVLFEGKRADMIFTDPPYKLSYGDKNKYLNAISPGNRIQTPIQNDHSTEDETNDFWYKYFLVVKTILASVHSYYIFSPQIQGMMMMMMMKSGMPYRHVLIWNKNNHVLGRTDYNYKHEPMLFGWMDKSTHKFYGKGENTKSVWDYNKPHKSELHPTMKPIELIVNAILNSSLEKQLIHDSFLGSGSTLIACEQTNRICYGIELDEHYIDVILRRYKKLYPDAKFECLNRKYNFKELFNEKG